MTTIANIVRQLIDGGAATRREIVGCTSEEVEEIRLDQNVERLPASYEEFLTTMGRSAGRLLVGTDVLYPNILGIKADAKDLFEESNFSIKDFSECVVIAMHQGYEVYWLNSFRDDDPAVLMYHMNESAPRRRWANLTEFLTDAMTEVVK